ncbi:hypothetical protein [Alicyclobacillus mengziensis]|uniref:Uncharacterized protein n=1 Tax=Alicyclobacillus mengziensis TaxID=2931921 RepID=A0A9X7Z8Y4_9BACL|nr:hypothetical protein [Alicyclobacillus mengziensis]QSO50132.1 hypothetical protein JZ786_24510 [Alicyclobacillus mengziensis]
MPNRHLILTDQASTMLDDYKEKYPKRSYGDITSEAIVQYVLAEDRDYADKLIERRVNDLLRKEFNRMVAVIRTVGIDTQMILLDTLTRIQRDRPTMSIADIYNGLRKDAISRIDNRGAFKDFVERPPLSE